MTAVQHSIASLSSRGRGSLVALLGLLPVCAVASNVWQINVVGDMYAAGRSVPHPSAEKPVYYYPVVIGYAARGAKLAGAPEQSPSKKALVHELAAALAAQGYRVTQEVDVPAKATPSQQSGEPPPPTVKALAPPPSLLLVFSWGSLRPEKLDTSEDVTSSSPPAVLNQNQMIGLIAGKKFDSIVDFGQQTEDVWEGVQDDRFYVMVSAYDFSAYNQSRKKVLLWVTKMSLPASGVTMAEVMPALIKAGGPQFGRETIGPKILEVLVVPEGRVEIGTPTVVPPQKN